MAGITIQEELVVKGIVSQEELQIPFRIGVDGVTLLRQYRLRVLYRGLMMVVGLIQPL